MSNAEEPIGTDHSQGLLLLRWLGRKLRRFRVRDLADALNRGGPFE